MEKLQPDLIKDRILAKIKSGEANMKPRWHFILKAILWILGTVLVGLVIMFVLSFILFSLRQTGVWFVPAFGVRGVGVFLRSLPWLLILTAFIFIVVLEILVKKYSFAYRQPLLFSVLGIIFIVGAGTIFISLTDFHKGVYLSVQEGHWPVAQPLYGGFGMMDFDDVHRGEITFINEDGFIIVKPPADDEFKVIISSQTHLPFGMDFRVGDTVVVFGEAEDQIIDALGVRKLDENVPPRFHAGPGMRERFYIPR